MELVNCKTVKFSKTVKLDETWPRLLKSKIMKFEIWFEKKRQGKN